MFIFVSASRQISRQRTTNSKMTTTRPTLFDPLRKKRVAYTPEEVVRQGFIQWLVKERNYPLQLMMSEYTISYNSRNFRCDIVCFTRDLKPLMVVECKAPEVKIDNSVIEQVTRYNMVLKVKFVVITNGVVTFALALDEESGKYKFIEDIPQYN